MLEHFERYNELVNRIRELEYKLTVIKNTLYGIRAVSYSDLPKVRSNEDYRINFITEKEELESEIAELQKEKNALYQKHLKEIEKVSNERYRSILRSLYLLKLTYEDIEKMMNLSNVSVRKLKSLAIKEFKRVNNIY